MLNNLHLQINHSTALPPIGQVGKLFANGTVDRGPIPAQVIPKTQKMVLDTVLLNTPCYKVQIKGKVEECRERSGVLPSTSVL